MTMFERVPKPSFSLSGIHIKSTKTLIMKVVRPMLRPVLIAKPWANTDQGALPIEPWISKASPSPKIARPKKSIDTR